MPIETLKNGTSIFCSPPHVFGEDALLLAEFARVKPSDKVIDAGTGCGIIALYWHDRGHAGRCTALDISQAAVSLVQKAVVENDISHITPICADLREYKTDKPYDVMACNPPYFQSGPAAKDAQRAAARHETTCSITDVCAAAKRLLKNGGRLCVCMKPQRLADVFCAMRENSLEPKRMQAVCGKKDFTPRLYLIEAGKNRSVGLTVLPPLIL